jgi:CheY-like chemotaxis protein
VALVRIDLLTRMPGLEGLALIRQVRTRLPLLPILYVANQDKSTAETERELPVDVPVLREPFTAEELRAAVLQLLPPDE